MTLEAHRILLLPGWLNSGPEHWQSRWEAAHGDTRVEQADWEWPRRGDWMARLEEVLLADPRPALLVAHSLGCHLAACWAGHSAHRSRVAGALLVAPPDLGRDDLPPQLHNWRPKQAGQGRVRLPFPATVVISSDDPFGSAESGAGLAADWGASMVMAGARGHLNSESGLGDWDEGRALLADLAARAGASDTTGGRAPA